MASLLGCIFFFSGACEAADSRGEQNESWAGDPVTETVDEVVFNVDMIDEMLVLKQANQTVFNRTLSAPVDIVILL